MSEKRKPEDSPSKLTLEDLVEVVQAHTEVDEETAKKIVLTIFGSMIRGLRKKENVSIRTFGIFRVKHRGERKKWVHVLQAYRMSPAHNTVTFEHHKYVDYLLNPHQYEEDPDASGIASE